MGVENSPPGTRTVRAGSGRDRVVMWAEPGLLRIRQRAHLRGGQAVTDATGPYWVVAVVQVHRGALRYVRGREQVAPPGRRFAVFMPPWSIVRVEPTTECVASTEALVSSAPLFGAAPARPIAWRWHGDPPQTVRGIARAVLAADASVEVSLEVAPSVMARRVKATMDEAYCRPVTLARLAAEAGRSVSVMSRAFKRAYGMPPVEYRHRLRIVDAIVRLASGGDILTVVHDVGFGDASRLYRHFRSLLCEPPGAYAPRRSRNTKT